MHSSHDNSIGSVHYSISWWWLIAVILAAVVITAIFWIDPAIDLHVSAFFFKHGAFVYHNFYWFNFIRHLLNTLVWLTCAVCAVGFLLSLIFKGRLTFFKARICLYILLCFALAPGLIVNTLLKNNWGQPRPLQITQFGGTKHYEKAWVISNQCPTNCAFVCGDCAAAFAFFAFVPLLRRRKTALSVVSAFALLIGFIRISQGGHFLSDVLLAYCIDFVVIFLLYKAFFRSDTKHLR